MPFVRSKCTKCGANLEVDNSMDAAICPFCGAPYIVEKAINNYQETENISANTVNVSDVSQSDFVILAGVLKSYTGKATDVIIPDSVTEIGKDAFRGLPITSVVIP